MEIKDIIAIYTKKYRSKSVIDALFFSNLVLLFLKYYNIIKYIYQYFFGG